MQCVRQLAELTLDVDPSSCCWWGRCVDAMGTNTLHPQPCDPEQLLKCTKHGVAALPPVAPPGSPNVVFDNVGTGGNRLVRSRLSMALGSVRRAYEWAIMHGHFTATDISDVRLLDGNGQPLPSLPCSADPMGTMAAAMSILHWLMHHVDNSHLMLTYESRTAAAAALLMAQKLKSEDKWAAEHNIAAAVMQRFLEPGERFHYPVETMSRDVFTAEANILLAAPVHLLVEENPCVEAEVELARLTREGKLDVPTAHEALGRVFMYFYAGIASANTAIDPFQATAATLSTVEQGQALVALALRSTQYRMLMFEYPLAVHELKDALSELALNSGVIFGDAGFFDEVRAQERKRVGLLLPL